MFLFRSEFQGLRTSEPVLEFQSKGWQAQDTGRASVSVQVCRQEKQVSQFKSSQARGILPY